MIKEITSPNNEYIKELNKLNNKKYRDEAGKFIVEGYHLVDMAKPYLETLLITDMKDYNIIPNVNYILTSNEVINKLSQTKSPQGIIGIAKIKKAKEISSNKILILDGVQDPGNVGALVRSALAFGFEDIILSKDSCDIYNDKVIRASQGAIFDLNIIYEDLIETISVLKNNGYKVYGTALHNSTPINEIKLNDKAAVILGNEGNGVRKEILEITNNNIYLPISSKIDSLNVSVAGSIVMYEFTK